MQIQNSRIIIKRTDVSAITPTIPTSDNHTDGSWLPTDLYKGEFFINTEDERLWYRSEHGIVEVTAGATATPITDYVSASLGGTFSGNIQIVPDLEVGGQITVQGDVVATGFYGDGSGLTNISAIFAGGTVANFSIFEDIVEFQDLVKLNTLQALSGTDIVVNSNLDVSGSVTATTFIGDGSQLTGLPSAQNYYTTAANLIGNVLSFDRTDTNNAYSVDLSGLAAANAIAFTNWDAVNNELEITLNDGTVIVQPIANFTDLSVSGTVTADHFIGDGSGLYNLTAPAPGATNGLSAYGNEIGLGGTLNPTTTIIAGATGNNSYLFLGNNSLNENLGQLMVNAQSFLSEQLISYGGTGRGTIINSNPANFESINNVVDGQKSTIFNNAATARIAYSSNKKIQLNLIGTGIAPGSGESFTVNGVTFTEGIDFTGQSDGVLDATTIAGLNYSGVPYFISVEHTVGIGSITFNFSVPSTIILNIANSYLDDYLYISEAVANDSGIRLTSSSAALIIGNTQTIFVDNTPNQYGIQYNDNYHSTYTNRSLVDKEYVLNAIAGTTAASFDYIDFNTSYTPTQQEGRLHWDADYGTLDVDLEGNNINLKVGLDNLYYIKNQSGATINKGSVVRAAGTLGSSGRILGDLMIADNTIPHYFTLGIAGENILNGDDGYVYEFGLVRGIDTTGTPYGETWVDGDILYVSPTTAGGLTKVKPTEPNLKIQVAIVIDADANGSIFIRPSLGEKLEDLHNVQTAGATGGDLIAYDYINGYWEYTKTLNGDYTISGGLTAAAFYGDGSNLTGKLSNVVDDTTPQLGGNLDVNGNKIVSVSNGNIDIEPDGTGNVLLGNFIFDADQTVGAGEDDYVLTYDNATGLISLEAAAGGGGGGHVIYSGTGATALPQQPGLRFKGYLEATDDAINSETEVDIASGSLAVANTSRFDLNGSGDVDLKIASKQTTYRRCKRFCY